MYFCIMYMYSNTYILTEDGIYMSVLLISPKDTKRDIQIHLEMTFNLLKGIYF